MQNDDDNSKIRSERTIGKWMNDECDDSAVKRDEGEEEKEERVL